VQPIDLSSLKRKVSGRLLALPWVSGVGVAQEKLAVYLARAASSGELNQVQRIVDSEATGAQVEFVQSGTFNKQ
jgi:hypothetical protein